MAVGELLGLAGRWRTVVWRRLDQLKRREFITLLGGAAARSIGHAVSKDTQPRMPVGVLNCNLVGRNAPHL